MEWIWGNLPGCIAAWAAWLVLCIDLWLGKKPNCMDELSKKLGKKSTFCWFSPISHKWCTCGWGRHGTRIVFAFKICFSKHRHFERKFRIWILNWIKSAICIFNWIWVWNLNLNLELYYWICILNLKFFKFYFEYTILNENVKYEFWTRMLNMH